MHLRPISRQQNMLLQHGSVAVTASSAPNKSPDAPEETHTTNNLEVKSTTEFLRCQLCKEMLSNADELQKHWITHISNLNNTRPFICQECDAGFTTAEALNSHSTTHLS